MKPGTQLAHYEILEAVAYSSNETGAYEVYVEASGLGGPGPEASVGRARISDGGGYQPRWNSDGTELLYLTPDATLVSASVDGSGASFEAEGTTLLFDVPIFPSANDETASANGDVFPDDLRFLFNTTIEDDTTGEGVSPPINVLLNWQALLED